MARSMMSCGHVSQGSTADGAPACVICQLATGEKPTPVAPPDLTGRQAVCGYGGHKPVPSSIDLAFFEHRPNAATDAYYCGCHGWD